MAKTKTRPWDVVEHLETVEDMAAYLEAALEEGDPALIAAAMGDIARAKGITQIARETGLGRESLYKALAWAHHCCSSVRRPRRPTGGIGERGMGRRRCRPISS